MKVAIAAALAIAVLAPGPASADDEKAKREARAFMREGVRLFSNGEYEAALDLFRTAYGRFASPKILLNIGTTFRELGRLVDAATTYEQYLRSAEHDPARRAELEGILTEIDRKVGKLRFELEEPGLRLELDGVEVVELPATDSNPAPSVLRSAKPAADWSVPVLVPTGTRIYVLRVAPGKHVVRAQSQQGTEVERTVTVTAAEEQRVRLFDVPDPREEVTPPPDSEQGAEDAQGTDGSPADTGGESGGGAVERVATTNQVDDADEEGPAVESAARPRARGRFGASLGAAADGKGRGVVFVPGVHVALGARYELVAAALVGYSPGVYGGGVAFFGDGAWRPFVAVGVPIFFRDGARVGVRAAGGLEWAATGRLGLTLQAGAEYFPTAEEGFEKLLFVPVLGVVGRL